LYSAHYINYLTYVVIIITAIILARTRRDLPLGYIPNYQHSNTGQGKTKIGGAVGSESSSRPTKTMEQTADRRWHITFSLNLSSVPTSNKSQVTSHK
jgi:hypothetical protein